MKKLWQKNWQLNTVVEKFETKDDLVLDGALLESDILGSLAHAAGLVKIGVLKPQEFKTLQTGLKKIKQLADSGKFALKFGDEDIHTKIENFLTEHYGAVGKKIHTGRSRNDQVLTALRLYTKEQLNVILGRTLELASALVTFGKKYGALPLPGYTHLQKAMPTNLAAWAGALAAGLLDSYALIQGALALNDQSPLGSAAGYGVPLPLPRAYTAQLLGFNKVQESAIYCQNSRGKFEAATVAALIAAASEINKFASDTLLFTTSEFNYFSVAKELCSGSSIMPQKKNVDIAELLRSKIHVLLGNYVMLVGISSNLPLGYNRDLQDTKKPLMESLAVAANSLLVAKILVENIKPNASVLKQAMTPELFATHRALALVKKGLPFRDAYRQASAEVGDATKQQLLKSAGGAWEQQAAKTEQRNLKTLEVQLAKAERAHKKTSAVWAKSRARLFNIKVVNR